MIERRLFSAAVVQALKDASILADLAHVTDKIGHEAATRVKAAVRHNGFQFGQFVAVGLDEG